MITRLTPSLLSAWDWSFRKETGFDEFMATLRREPREYNEAMQAGLRFEAFISAASNGFPLPDDHEWANPVNQAGAILAGSASQVRGERGISVSGHDYLLVGVADNIKAGIIYDTKLSHHYQFGRYADSPQHPAYFYLWPMARRFVYLVSDGRELYQETYYPFDTPPIEEHIDRFRRYLDEHKLTDTYQEHWRID